MISRSSTYVYVIPFLATIAHLSYLLSPFFSVDTRFVDGSIRVLSADNIAGFPGIAGVSLFGLLVVLAGSIFLAVTDWAYQRIVILAGAVVTYFLPMYTLAYFAIRDDGIDLGLHWGAGLYTVLIFATVIVACLVTDDAIPLEDDEESITVHSY